MKFNGLGKMTIEQILARRTAEPVMDRQAASFPNADLTAERDADYPGYTFHDIRWLQKSLNYLGACAGPINGRFNRQLPVGIRFYALAGNFIPDHILPEDASQASRIGIDSRMSHELQSRKLPLQTSCPLQAEAGIVERVVLKNDRVLRLGALSTEQATSDIAKAATEAAIKSIVPWVIIGGVALAGLIGLAVYFARKR